MYKNELAKWVGEFLVGELQELLDGLDDNTPTSEYPYGVVTAIFDYHWANGSYTCNAWKSREWIREHYEDIQSFVFDLRHEQDIEVADVWESEEQFQLDIMYHMSLKLVGESSTLNYSYTTMNDLLRDLIQEFSE